MLLLSYTKNINTALANNKNKSIPHIKAKNSQNIIMINAFAVTITKSFINKKIISMMPSRLPITNYIRYNEQL